MRLPLAMLEVFVAIARHGSLRAAANALGLKPSTVSHQLKSLETQLSTALFVRTTRSVRLTEAGRALMRSAGPAFGQLSEAVENARTTGHAARGTLKLAMPDFVYHLLVGPILAGFVADYPQIVIDLSLTDGFSDILGEERHAGFRLGDRISQDMVAVRLTQPMKLAVLGSPAYFARHGVPQTPDDLLRHNCIRYRFQTSGRIYPWRFSGEAGEQVVDVSGNLVASTLPAVIDLTARGLGLSYTFRRFAQRELDDGRLSSALDGEAIEVPGVYIYFPKEYREMVPLRLFLERLKEQRAA